MKVSKKLAIIVTILMSVAIGSGCATQRKPLPPVPTRNVPPSSITPAPRMVPPTSLRPVPRFHTAGIVPNKAAATASRLATKISKMRYVNKATVVIVGSTAYVGLDVKANVVSNRVNTLKRDVISLVKRNDRNIRTVTVASDPATVTRIKAIASGVAAGKPISTFTRELSDIGRRIMPVIK